MKAIRFLALGLVKQQLFSKWGKILVVDEKYNNFIFPLVFSSPFRINVVKVLFGGFSQNQLSRPFPIIGNVTLFCSVICSSLVLREILFYFNFINGN